MFHDEITAMFQLLRTHDDGFPAVKQQDRFFNGDEPRTREVTVSLECHKQSLVPEKALLGTCGISADEITLHSQKFKSLQSSQLQCTPVWWGENWSSASGVRLVFARLPVKSVSSLTLTLQTVPGSSVLTIGDCSNFLSEESQTIKLVPDDSVSRFARRAHTFRRLMFNKERVSALALLKSREKDN